MAYGDYDGPDKLTKGQEGGACNRQRCQAEPALWYNHGSHAWYCLDCAIDIGQDTFNLPHWNAFWRPRCGHPQFETREEITAREEGRLPVGTIVGVDPSNGRDQSVAIVGQLVGKTPTLVIIDEYHMFEEQMADRMVQSYRLMKQRIPKAPRITPKRSRWADGNQAPRSFRRRK